MKYQQQVKKNVSLITIVINIQYFQIHSITIFITRLMPWSFHYSSMLHQSDTSKQSAKLECCPCTNGDISKWMHVYSLIVKISRKKLVKCYWCTLRKHKHIAELIIKWLNIVHWLLPIGDTIKRIESIGDIWSEKINDDILVNWL